MNIVQLYDVLAKHLVKVVLSAVIVFTLLVTSCQSYVVVEGGSQGVVLKLGKISQDSLPEGLHFVTPFITSVKTINTRVTMASVEASAGTKDLQTVRLKVSVNYRIDSSKVVDIFRKVGNEAAVSVNIVAPANQEVIKANTAKYNAEELLTKRDQLKLAIVESLTSRLAVEGILVQDVSIADINFSDEFNKAIEAKQIASQSAQKAKYLAEQATNEAAGAIAVAKGQASSLIESAKGRSTALLMEAEAQAKANSLIKQSLTEELLRKQAIDKWNGAYPTTVLGTSTPMINIK